MGICTPIHRLSVPPAPLFDAVHFPITSAKGLGITPSAT